MNDKHILLFIVLINIIFYFVIQTWCKQYVTMTFRFQHASYVYVTYVGGTFS